MPTATDVQPFPAGFEIKDIVTNPESATRPARTVCSSHSRRIAGDGGIHGCGLNSSVYSRIRAASTLSVLLRPSLVRAKSRIPMRLPGLRAAGQWGRGGRPGNKPVTPGGPVFTYFSRRSAQAICGMDRGKRATVRADVSI